MILIIGKAEEIDGNRLVKVVYNFEVNEFKANDSITIIARITPQKDWHTYWKNPGDAGLATSLDFSMPDGFRVGDLEWEFPHTFPFDDMMNFGYNETSHLIFTIYSPSKLPGKSFPIIIKSNWLVCKDVCLPGSKIDTLIFNNISDIFEFPDFQRKLKSIRTRIPDLINRKDFSAQKGKDEVILKWKKSLKLPEKIGVFPVEEGIFKYRNSYIVESDGEFNIIRLELDKFRVSEPNKLKVVLVSDSGFGELSTKKAIELDLLF